MRVWKKTLSYFFRGDCDAVFFLNEHRASVQSEIFIVNKSHSIVKPYKLIIRGI